MNIVANIIDTIVDDSIKLKTTGVTNMSDVLDNWDIVVIMHLNPLGMYIDNASTQK
jgi:hypothetical protein